MAADYTQFVLLPRLIAYLTEHAPHVGKVAIVPQPTGLEAAAFWEDVAVNRGLQVRVFRTLDAARTWLGVSRPSPS